MKFNCGLTPEEKAAKAEALAKERVLKGAEWQDVFAWRPVRVGSGDCRWLETVEYRYPGYVNQKIGHPDEFDKDSPEHLFNKTWERVAFWYGSKIEYRAKQRSAL